MDTLILRALFAAILLAMVDFGNRHTVLANLIRHLHDEVIRDSISPKDAGRLLLHISRVSDRLRLIGIKQFYTAVASVFALASMIAAYFSYIEGVSHLFLASIFLLMGFMLLFTREIQVATTALDVHLSNLEAHQK